MKKRTAVLLVMALAIATTVAAAPGGKGFRPGFGAPGEHPRMDRSEGDRLGRLAAFLDLSEGQIEQWKGVHEARAEALKGGFGGQRDMHQQIREMALADKPDAAAIGELVIAAQRQMAAAQAEREAFRAELMTILTPEQQERFEALVLALVRQRVGLQKLLVGGRLHLDEVGDLRDGLEASVRYRLHTLHLGAQRVVTPPRNPTQRP